MNKPPNMIVPYKKWAGISRIEGLAKGLSGIEEFEDFNKEGVVSGLKEIAALANEISESGKMEKDDD